MKEENDRNETTANAQAVKQTAKKDEQDALERKQQERLVKIRQHMKELDEAKQWSMRQFLMKAIIPVLTEGMIDVYRVKPTDPVDYLAEYIYNKSNEVHAKK